jgi:Protein of unknown function (DUF2752)
VADLPLETGAARTGRAWVAPLSVAALALAGCAYLGWQDPYTRGALVPQCPTKLLTGLDCPFCGGLRMVRSLTSGQWSAAAHDNLLLLVSLPFLLLVWARWLVAGLGGPAFEPRLSRRTVIVLAVVGVLWMVVRNLPVWPLHPIL